VIAGSEDVVLFVYAHPDDLLLSCGGTAAKLIESGYTAYSLELTAGERSSTVNGTTCRQGESRASAEYLGYTPLALSFPDGKLVSDVELISTIERCIREVRPRIVVTHAPQPNGHSHQDHMAASSATVMAAMRCPDIEYLVYSEPSRDATGFVPNIYVDITDYFDRKIQAIHLHSSERDKYYLQEEYIATRGHWWRNQAMPHGHSRFQYFEAFTLVKAVAPRNALPFSGAPSRLFDGAASRLFDGVR
jgi:LmbE family N-acetylglucosaminyl deacetylase